MKLPKTDIFRYISGRHSLNVDLEDGTGYDWHFMNHWLGPKANIKTYGRMSEINTNDIFGYYGVAERSAELRKAGLDAHNVYMANHHRAIADLVYESLIKHKQIGYAKGCISDFFFTDHDVQELYIVLNLMLPYLDEERREILDEWFAREFRSIHRSSQIRAL